MRLPSLAIWALLAMVPLSARADDVDPQDADALAKTQSLLKDPSQRAAAVKRDRKASEADAKAREVGKTDANTQAIYDLSASVMQTLVEASGGDANKMLEILAEAKSNPEKLAAMFTPEQRAQLEKIAKEIEASEAANAKASAATPPAKSTQP